MITIITILVWETVTDIKGVFNTPEWLDNLYEKVVDFWMCVIYGK